MTGNPSAVATIAVSPSSGGVGASRAMAILVDGREVAALLTGNRVVLEVAGGSHRVSAQVDWARSPDLTVPVTEIAVSFPLMSGMLNLALRPRRAILITARP